MPGWLGKATRRLCKVAIASQAQHFRSRRNTFAGDEFGTVTRSGADFVAGAALSQGEVQISRQAPHFCR